MTRAGLKRLERWQTRELRHIPRSQAHMHRVSNSDIRRRANIFIVSSTLLYRRLQWWRHVIARGLLPGPPDHEPAIAVRS
eukprot:9225971-Pyramimonas_sp.AAC.1